MDSENGTSMLEVSGSADPTGAGQPRPGSCADLKRIFNAINYYFRDEEILPTTEYASIIVRRKFLKNIFLARLHNNHRLCHSDYSWCYRKHAHRDFGGPQPTDANHAKLFHRESRPIRLSHLHHNCSDHALHRVVYVLAVRVGFL